MVLAKVLPMASMALPTALKPSYCSRSIALKQKGMTEEGTYQLLCRGKRSSWIGTSPTKSIVLKGGGFLRVLFGLS